MDPYNNILSAYEVKDETRPVQARARCRTRPRLDTCLDRNGCARFAFRPRSDPMFVPVATYVRGVCARFHASAPRVRARSHPSVLKVLAGSHPSVPIPMRRIVCAPARPPARTARLPTSFVRPPHPPDKEISSIFEHIRAYSSIFEDIQVYSRYF
jgi:hypothetical protein